MVRLQVLSGEHYQEDKALQNITIIFRKSSCDINQKQGHALLILKSHICVGKGCVPTCIFTLVSFPIHHLVLILFLRELGFIFTYIWGLESILRGRAWSPVVGEGGCWSHGIYGQEVEWTPVLRQRALSLSLPETPAHSMASPMFSCDVPTSVNLIEITPHTNTKRFLSPMTLDPVEMTILTLQERVLLQGPLIKHADSWALGSHL